MKIKKYILLFLILTFASYFLNVKPNDFYKRGNDFLKNSKKFQKENNLILSGYGINLNESIETPERNSIHKFYVTFFSKEKLNLNAAREKLIKSIGNFLAKINNDVKIRNYIYEYPFNYKGLHFSIAFYSEEGKPRKEKYIHSCTLAENSIYYKIAYPNGTFKRIHEETYEEALKIVESQKSNKEIKSPSE
ncbi:MAG: hypothetical protein K940chlam5_00891 [Candidatus Anoxychlamydiales bacterium]|nr:hypothetical protein [Candidatus Anoxychlamydiales bacterium]